MVKSVTALPVSTLVISLLPVGTLPVSRLGAAPGLQMPPWAMASAYWPRSSPCPTAACVHDVPQLLPGTRTKDQPGR